MRLKKIFLIIIFCLFVANEKIFAKHYHPEKYYQRQWCLNNNGILEYKLFDNTRVDCLTKNYAVEFDFASKWAESIGQSLYYAEITKKKPAIVLIIEKPEDFKYFQRVKKLTEKYNIALWYICSH